MIFEQLLISREADDSPFEHHSDRAADFETAPLATADFSLHPNCRIDRAPTETNMANYNGSDDADYWVGTTDRDRANGNGGNDTLIGGGGVDTLIGGAGADYLELGDDGGQLHAGEEVGNFTAPSYGLDHVAPVLDTGSEVDTIVGGLGQDWISAGYGDNIDAGGSFDTLFISFLGADTGVTADFSQSTLVIGGGTLTGIDQVNWMQGSNFDDHIIIGDGRVTVYQTVAFGMGGDDHLEGGANTQYIDGGEGNDRIIGGGSLLLREIVGGAGNDTIDGGSYNTWIYGDAGDDTIDAYATVYGGSGNDTITLASRYDFSKAFGEDGDDEITILYNGARAIFGGSGADTLNGGGGNDTLVAGAAGDSDAPTHDDGAEHDVLSGGAGRDRIWAGYGDDVDGGEGDDRLYLSLAGASSKVVFKSGGLDTEQGTNVGGGVIRNIEQLVKLIGSDYGDRIVLATQSVAIDIDARTGNDVVISDASTVHLRGGEGNDRFRSGIAADSFDGGEGIDTVDYIQAASGVTVTLGLDHGDAGTGGGDSLVNVERVFGSVHADHISGSNNNDRFKGRDGDDTIIGNDGRDRAYGNDGDDWLVGGAGRDILSGQNGADRVEGGADDDRVSGNDGDDLLFGNEGNDILFGGDGNDLLNGGAGDDKLLGDAGDDVLRGSAGSDRFVFRGAFGIDEIADFTSGVDKIGLADLRDANGGDRLTIDQLLITQQGADTWIELDLDQDGTADVIDLDGDGIGDQVRIELADLDATTLTAADFQF